MGTNELAWRTVYPTTTADTFSAVTTDQSGVLAATMTVGTWTRYSVTFTVPAAAVRGYSVIVSRTTTTTSTTTLYAGAQLELGSVATAFRRNAPSFQAELAACQRYYYRITNPSATTNAIASGAYYSTTASYFPVRMPVTMRVAPTFARSATVGNFLVLAGGSSRAATATAQYGTVSTDVVTINVTTAAGTAGQGAWLETATSGAFLEFSSEL